MSERQPFEVDFPFRGSRGYVHSTSIANHWSDRAPDADRFELVLKGWMTSRVRFRPATTPGEGTGYVKIVRGDHTELWQMDEDPAHPVQSREPFDEAAIPATVEVEDRTAEVLPAPGATWFDRLIKGNKALIETVLAPGVPLIAAKIATHGFPPDDAPLSLRLKSHAGTRIFKSTILMDGSPYGELVFYGD